MKKLFYKSKRGLIIALIAVFSLSGLGFIGDHYFELSKNLDIYVTLVRELNTYYVDEIDPASLIKTGINAMLKSLDPYTVFIPESDIEDFKFMTTGNYGGIGALIEKRGNYVRISQPYENFPADKAGLRAGDEIYAINGKDMKGKSTSDVSDLLKGDPGTSVTISIQRPGRKEPFDIDIKREKIHIDNVPYYGMINKDIAYINLSSFRENAHDEIKKAIKELQKKHTLTSLIIDLRSNPGGLLHEAVRISNIFVPKNELIVSTKGKVSSWNKDYRTYENPVEPDMPLVILVNENSASASEIVSGALQDLDRAVIIGQKTFGKGLVQTTRELSYNAQLKVTTSKYYIPSGRCIQALDYFHKDDQGRAIKIPDSLVSAFQTRSGRTVYDGAGITPDIEIEPEDYKEILNMLRRDGIMFDFTTQYRNDHDSIPHANKFKITDQEYDNFVDFVRNKSFSYKSNTEKSLEILKNNAEKDLYFEIISDNYNNMLQKIKDIKEKELFLYKKEIIKILEEEIIGRYYYIKGRIIYSTIHDKEIHKAIEILSDKNEYQKILQPQEGENK
jgi:carboxyl-terminal processing protease